MVLLITQRKQESKRAKGDDGYGFEHIKLEAAKRHIGRDVPQVAEAGESEVQKKGINQR